MKLTSILNPDYIVCNLSGNTREEIYKEMLEKVINQLPDSLSVDGLYQEIIEREDSIKMPYESIALPHVRNNKVNDLYVIIGILPNAVKLKDYDLGESQVVIMSLITDEMSDLYLKSLAAFTRFLLNKDNFNNFVGQKNPSELLNLLNREKVTIKSHVTAEDVMNRDLITVTEDDLLSNALNIMTAEKRQQLVVLNNEGKISGVLRAKDIIKSYIPQYILDMSNLKFITSFEPFDKIFKEEHNHKIKEFTKTPDLIINKDTPLIQFTVPLSRGDADVVLVSDENNQLLGTIALRSIIHKVLRG
ncbi:PTS sugar transporter subunit IIA [Lentisphaerota bacterium WC36G]|nr:PTS sugar transporter subunit IIA [Lentisphaerae bacterium WC36]